LGAGVQVASREAKQGIICFFFERGVSRSDGITVVLQTQIKGLNDFVTGFLKNLEG
jgi:hypothetical protein